MKRPTKSQPHTLTAAAHIAVAYWAGCTTDSEIIRYCARRWR